jgi:2-oxoisovalerate dehydrogenase E1 component alpha subunit
MIGEEFVQLLTPEGERIASTDYESSLGRDDILSLFRDMVIVRRLCNESTSLQRQGQLALWAPVQGQEAAQVGAGRAMAPMDFRFLRIASTASRGVVECHPKTCYECFAPSLPAAGIL